jgi:hypothetical protein
LGGGEQLFKVPAKQTFTAEDVYLEFDVGFAAPLEWNRVHNAIHQPYFFYSTSEIVKSWLEIPYIKSIIQYPDILRHPANVFSIKPVIIRSFFTTQPIRMKYNGFENILPLRQKSEQTLQAKSNDVAETYQLPITLLISQLTNTPR